MKLIKVKFNRDGLSKIQYYNKNEKKDKDCAELGFYGEISNDINNEGLALFFDELKTFIETPKKNNKIKILGIFYNELPKIAGLIKRIETELSQYKERIFLPSFNAKSIKNVDSAYSDTTYIQQSQLLPSGSTVFYCYEVLAPSVMQQQPQRVQQNYTQLPQNFSSPIGFQLVIPLAQRSNQQPAQQLSNSLLSYPNTIVSSSDSAFNVYATSLSLSNSK